MTRYTVKQLADLARISVRTLHHYDEIGLLKPAWLGDNGYRYYEQAQLYRLQQVLLYRDFGMGLEDIRIVLDAPGFDTVSALREHRARMVERLERQQQLIGVIDDTLTRMKGDTTMQDENLYDWDSEAKRADYKQWLIERYAAQVDARLEADRQRREAMSADERQAMEERRLAIYRELIELYQSGMTADAGALLPVLRRHRDWLAFSWGRPCDPHAYKVTADILAENPDYRQRLEAGSEGFAEWLRDAMKTHADRLLERAASV